MLSTTPAGARLLDHLPRLKHLPNFLFSPSRVNPFRTPVPFWGQLTYFLTGLSPKRNCGSKRVKSVSQTEPKVEIENQTAFAVWSIFGREVSEQNQNVKIEIQAKNNGEHSLLGPFTTVHTCRQSSARQNSSTTEAGKRDDRSIPGGR